MKDLKHYVKGNGRLHRTPNPRLPQATYRDVDPGVCEVCGCPSYAVIDGVGRCCLGKVWTIHRKP